MLYAYPMSLEEARSLARQALVRGDLRIPSELRGRSFERYIFPNGELAGKQEGLYMPSCVVLMDITDDIVMVDGDGTSPIRYSHIRVLDREQAEGQLAYEAGLRDLLSRINGS